MKLVTDTLTSVPQGIEDKRMAHLRSGRCDQGLCMDAGYDYEEVREVVWQFGYTAHIRSRGEEVKARKAGRRSQGEESGSGGTALGSRKNSQRAQSLPPFVGEMGKESTELPRYAALGMRAHHLE